MLLGGVFTDLLSWEWIFFLNIPVGITALALAPVLLGESRDVTHEGFDALGAVLVTGGLSAAVFGITQANDWGWSSGRTIGVFAAAVALLAGFVVRETRAEHPLMSFSIFRIKTVAGANIAGLHPRHGALLDVPDADALHAAGARVLAARDGHRVHRRRRRRRSSGRWSRSSS